MIACRTCIAGAQNNRDKKRMKYVSETVSCSRVKYNWQFKYFNISDATWYLQLLVIVLVFSTCKLVFVSLFESVFVSLCFFLYLVLASRYLNCCKQVPKPVSEESQDKQKRVSGIIN